MHLRGLAMGLNKVKIGSFVKLYNCSCGIPHLTNDEVSGINRDKEFFEPSKQVGADTSKYKVVPPDFFACNLMHVGRDVVLPIAINHSSYDKYVSPAYTVFEIDDEERMLREYFYLFLRSDERDRYFWFHTDSSVRDGLDWDTFCDLEVDVPSITVQRKYVEIYYNLQKNLESIQRGIEQMERTCTAFMDKIAHSCKRIPMGEFIEETDYRNTDLIYSSDDVKGMTITKQIIPTKANMNNTAINNFKIVLPGEFVYNPRTHGKKIGLGFNQGDKPFIISWNNACFRIKKDKTSMIIPEYLYLCICREEWDREACFRSWGSSTEVFSWEALCEMKIAVPNYDIQKDIVGIYSALNSRYETAKKIEALQKKICPILIKGATKEGKRS